ncbi:hypothetical protein [Streptomyces sp. ME19-01-6]|uniref:hypothetical protein n=1 Tax=Streptomyces sp. ME19-01-6 TaxID=3028686 RepID=UPI0029ABC27C|nr:hypothetical protein [Streptomyces sp. ME19-01-6]MDX3233789.1 hypothetical protein [Streptomyces sp. ME19-01-6]
MALVAIIAAVGFSLVGPAATASAAPPPPSPTSDSSDREPSRWKKLQGQWNKWQWKMYESWVAAALDRHDPYYKWKLPWQIVTQQVFERFGGGGTGFSIKDDGPKIVKGVEELLRRWKETPDGLRRQVTKRGDKIHDLNQKIDQAQTPAEREKLEKDWEKARGHARYVNKEHWKVKQTQPDAESVEAKIRALDTKITNLKNKISSLEEETKKSIPNRRQKLQQLKTARENLTQATTDRSRLQGPPDDDGDTGGTRTTPRDPKQPPKGPVSTDPTATSTTSKKTTAKGTKGTTATRPTITPKGTRSTTATGPTTTPRGTRSTTPSGPTASWKGWSSLKTPKTGFRGSTGTNQMADAIAWVIADGISQDYAAHLDRRDQQLLEQARKDPALAKRIIDDYSEIKDNNDIEVLFRSFESKGFTQGATRKVAPELIKSQKALDTAKAVADKSNADPLYQQARTECGGYDTCVTERTDKLRKQNAKAVADSTKKAKESNADPLYQQARVECGGYDTCVTERTDKLRTQKKATTTKTTTRTADAHKTTTAKTGQTKQHKTQNAKAIAESTKKAKKSNADPLYQQARKECGGYDTCVTDRVDKLRAQKKATTTKTTTRTEQHKQTQSKQSQKKTQTSDYRGKGGVRASAA